MPVKSWPLINSPLRARRLFLLPLVLFLLLLFGLGLRALRRRRGPGLRWRRALLLALARRSCLRPRSRLVPVWLGLPGCRTSGFGTVIRLAPPAAGRDYAPVAQRGEPSRDEMAAAHCLVGLAGSLLVRPAGPPVSGRLFGAG